LFFIKPFELFFQKCYNLIAIPKPHLGGGDIMKSFKRKSKDYKLLAIKLAFYTALFNMIAEVLRYISFLK
jgi:hypothetical protein